MASLMSICLALLFLAVFLDPLVAVTTLKVGFYQKTCPSAEAIVKSTVEKATLNDTGAPAALIRLHFHDCFVRGCEGSVLLDSKPGKQAEKDNPSNLGIGGFNIIDEAKAKIESICPNTVSCADIVAFAARDAVFKAGGLYYAARGGRRDGTVSLGEEASANLPGSFFSLAQLKENFARKGFSPEEMVTLSGAHSIGDSHCSSFSKRLYSFNSTYSQDPSINPGYANELRTQCPRPSSTSSGGPDPIVPFDPITPRKLDNQYYVNAKNGKVILATDQVLWDSASTSKMVQRNAKHPSRWAGKFAAAMVKMGSIDVLTGHRGEIRKNCRVVN